MTKPPANYLQRYLEKVIKEPGKSMTAISKGAGLHPDFVRDVIRGKSKVPNAENLQRIARFLGVPMEELIGAPSPAQEIRPPSAELDDLRIMICRRVACAVTACWGDQVDQAAEQLGVSKIMLRRVMAGKAVADELLLSKMVSVTKVTLDFLYYGKMDNSIPTKVGILIAHNCPDLVEWSGPSLAAVPVGVV